MRCPWCGHQDDKVIDSRPADGGNSIRRRRECLSCRRRYTSFERIEEIGLYVLKRDGTREPYVREKLVGGIRKAIVNRPAEREVPDAVERVEDRLRRAGPEVTSHQVGLEVLAELRRIDHVAYMRFASVYKDFQELDDFERELGALLRKRQQPVKPRAR